MRCKRDFYGQRPERRDGSLQEKVYDQIAGIDFVVLYQEVCVTQTIAIKISRPVGRFDSMVCSQKLVKMYPPMSHQ